MPDVLIFIEIRLWAVAKQLNNIDINVELGKFGVVYSWVGSQRTMQFAP